MAKKRWTAPFKVGDVTFRVPGATKNGAVRARSRFIKKHMKNIEQGFYAGGIFHPIRASVDYESGRLSGREGRRTRAVRRSVKKSMRRR
jgi:hypothetical protein